MNSKKKKIIIASVVAVAVIIALVTTGVLVSKKNKYKETQTTKPASKPLTASQKQWVIDNYFKKFPQHGAASGFEIIEQNDNNGLGDGMVFTQDDYKEQIARLFEDRKGKGSFVDYKVKGCEAVYYHFY